MYKVPPFKNGNTVCAGDGESVRESWGRREIRERGEIWEILTKTPTLTSSPSFPPLPNNPEAAVNLLVDLLKQTGYLQDRLISSLKEKHTREGGFSENLLKKRLEYKNNC